MRRLRVVVAVLLSSTLFAACEEPDLCGDGIVNSGESEGSCCLDTGCSFGVCDEVGRGCVDPWVLECSGGEMCLDDGPYFCRGNQPPAYDCGFCGCPGGGRCEQEVCWSADEIRERRDAEVVSSDLDVDVYFRLVDELQSPPLTLDEVSAEVAAVARTDRRHSLVLFALASSSDRELELGNEMARRLSDEGVLLSNGGVSLLERESLEAACATVEQLAVERFADEGAQFAFASAAEAHREACFHEGLWPRCGPPTLEGCATRVGRLPLTLILVDFRAALDVVDRALLIRATNRPEGERSFHLDEVISRWRESIDTWPIPGGFSVDLAGEPVIVRAAQSARYPGTSWWVSLPARAKAPWGLLGYRLLWNDGDTRVFLSQYDIVGRDCSWLETATEIAYMCENDGARVEALIDVTTQSLLSVARIPPA